MLCSPPRFVRTRSASCLPLPFPLLLLLLASSSSGCLLCPLHIPARPKPLDQFRLPSIQKIVHTADSFEWLCQNGSKLESVSEQCRGEVSLLSCSLTQLVQSFKTECPGPEEDEGQCAQCRMRNDRLYSENKWVLTWIDSVGKMPSGISDGNYHWLGDYEQCQRLKNDGLFNGQYCLLEFHVPDGVLRPEQCEQGQAEPLEVVLGICLPASCSQKETQGLVEYVADHRPIQVRCQPPRAWPPAALLLLCSASLWLCLVLSLSLLPWLLPSLRLPPLLSAFRLQLHLRPALRTLRSPPPLRFQAVQGLQCLSTAMLVLGQAQVWVMPFLENIGHHYVLLDSLLAQPMVNFSLYADGLFALSTFQLSYQYAFGQESDNGTLILRRRFLRFWPHYAFCTLAMAFLFSRLGEGPMWSRSDIGQRCEWNWASNLLLANNLLGHSHTCLDAGSLLALQSQFLVLSLLVLWLFARHPRPLLLVLCLSLALSVLFPLAVSLHLGSPPTLIPHRMDPSTFGPFADLLFLNPLARAGPFLVGLLAALWLLPRLLHHQHLLRALCPLGSVLVLLLLCLLLWLPHWLFVPSASPVLSALYASLHRPLWAALLLLGAILLDSSQENALNSFLCWRCFHPLSKLIYPVLLLSEPIALSLFSSLHRPVHSTALSTVLTWIGILVCSLFLALLLDIALTRPIRWICNGRGGGKGGEEKGREEGEKKGGEGKGGE